MDALKEKRFLPRHRTAPEERERVCLLIQERLALRPEILFAYLHGSFTKEETFRDIDVGLFLSIRPGVFYESDLSHDLTRMVGREVEVRVINKAPLAFQMAVVQEGRLLFSRDEQIRTDFIERVSKKYPEFGHFRNLFLGIAGVRRQ